MPEFYTIRLPEENIFRDFFGGVVVEGNPLHPSPTPMVGPQAPHQLNPALGLQRHESGRVGSGTAALVSL